MARTRRVSRANFINDFVPWAIDPTANVITQDHYLVDPNLGRGFERGLLISGITNKVWRQSTFVAAAIAQFMLEELDDNILDDGQLDLFVEQFREALRRIVPTVEGPPGPMGPGLRIRGLVDSEADLPTDAEQGDIWITRDTGEGWVWDSHEPPHRWINIGQVNQIELGEIDGGEYFA